MGTWFCRRRWKNTFLAGKRKRGMGIYLSDYDQDCLTNMRLANDVLLFAFSREQLQKMLCEFKRRPEKMGLRIHPRKTKILGNQSLKTKRKLKSITKVEILTREKREIRGPDDHFPATEDDRNQKSNQGCLGDVSQVQAETDIEPLPAQTLTPAIRRSDNFDGAPRIKNMDTHKIA